ncbi:MAG: hypothetical protein LBG75_00165 [Candidatus Nomurabacteria bacterium]|jgi:hypothetical protein|nr:hypothetical protein [Candidatus Nomurabacteria bacterium]
MNRTNNLKPFSKGYDSRRQRGRKKGSVNRKTVIQRILTGDIDPNMLLGSSAKRICEQIGNKSYLEALYFALLNLAMNGDAKAANTLLKELADAENKDPTDFYTDNEIRIVVVEDKDWDAPEGGKTPQNMPSEATEHKDSYSLL